MKFASDVYDKVYHPAPAENFNAGGGVVAPQAKATQKETEKTQKETEKTQKETEKTKDTLKDCQKENNEPAPSNEAGENAGENTSNGEGGNDGTNS